MNIKTYYSFPNIDETNNVFVYFPDNCYSWVKIKIPEGSYEIDEINNTIQHEMEKKGHHDPINEDYYINIFANSNTLKFVLILEKDYKVDFNHQNSIAKVLGFTGAKYTEGIHESENVINILSINSILVNIDVISGSYINGTMTNTIFSFLAHLSTTCSRGAFRVTGCPSSVVRRPSCVDRRQQLFKHQLLLNRWANLDQTWQECSLGGPL